MRRPDRPIVATGMGEIVPAVPLPSANVKEGETEVEAAGEEAKEERDRKIALIRAVLPALTQEQLETCWVEGLPYMKNRDDAYGEKVRA